VTGTSPRQLLLSAFLAALILASAGCGSDDSDDDETAATSRTSSVATTAESADALVGEWVTDNECQALADALAEAGLEEFTVDMAKGGGLLPPGEPDPSDPCKGAKPVEHSHTFSAGGDFNSYDENGKEVDFGTYETTGGDAFTLSRPPFKSEVRYQVDGDTATFEVVVPKCDTEKCRFGAALAIATFFPRTYERVE
jgi:hypothetical protein